MAQAVARKMARALPLPCGFQAGGQIGFFYVASKVTSQVQLRQ